MNILTMLFNNAFSIIFTVLILLWIFNHIWIAFKGWRTRRYWNEYYNEESQDYRDNGRQ